MNKTFYVYMLLDPRKNLKPFYIGKGTKNRAKVHLTKSSGHNKFCQRVIDKIRSTNQEPTIRQYKLITEKMAFDKEKESMPGF